TKKTESKKTVVTKNKPVPVKDVKPVKAQKTVPNKASQKAAIVPKLAKVDTLNSDSIQIALADTLLPKIINYDSLRWAKFDSVFQKPAVRQKAFTQSVSQARYVKNNISMHASRIKNLNKEVNTYIIEK